MDSQRQFQRVFSFEVFPPRTPEGVSKLRVVCDELAALDPSYFSVTSGTGGTRPDQTYDITKRIREQLGTKTDVAPHITCVGSTRDTVRCLLTEYTSLGIRHVVVVRGDPRSGPCASPVEFRYASELIAFIRAETGDRFHIEVAAYPEFHPEAPGAEADLENFKRKVKTGATSALTQYFYNADAYFHFVDSCERLGVILPIVPGIMPMRNYERLARFSDKVGVEIPRWMRKRLAGFGNDLVSLRAVGIDVVTSLCGRLLDGGAPGLHFYTMNSVEPTRTIWARLGLEGSPVNEGERGTGAPPVAGFVRHRS